MNRKTYSNNSPLRTALGYLNGSTVLFQNAMVDGQPQPRALPDLLGGKKRVENHVQIVV